MLSFQTLVQALDAREVSKSTTAQVDAAASGARRSGHEPW
jgi:hypothetical protein